MRTLWKGAISFGLVNIPVRMVTATQEKDIHLKYLHAKCSAPVKYEKRCVACGATVPSEEIVMGYEYEQGKYVVMRDEDLRGIPAESSRTIDILDFVSIAEIDPVYYDRSYYLEPAPGGEKAYALLRKAMTDSGKIAIAKVAIRNKSALACLRIRDRAVVMETMFYPDEIHGTEPLTGIALDPRLSEAEVSMAIDLVQRLAAPFDPAKYTDDYREQLMALIQARIAGAEVAVPAGVPQSGKVIDLLEALRASLAATARGTDKASDPGAGSAQTPAPRKRKARVG